MATDPTGQYVKVCREGNNIKLLLPMQFTGSESVPFHQLNLNKANWWVAAIEGSWGGGRPIGKYNVETKVVGSPVDGNMNTVHVVAHSTGIKPFVDTATRTQMVLQDVSSGATAAHEAGHLMGLSHESGSGIMHEVPTDKRRDRPTEMDIDLILRRNPTSNCCGQ